MGLRPVTSEKGGHGGHLLSVERRVEGAPLSKTV